MELTIELPISKSIANRLLIIQALRGDDLASFPITRSTPDDVRLLHHVLLAAQNITPQNTPRHIHLANCGTAMRFLTAFFSQREGENVILEGTTRMYDRPIGQLVSALQSLGADIRYLKKTGYPPLHIQGRKLNKKEITLNQPQSTQFVSALLLVGVNVRTDCRSPYITMTRRLLHKVKCTIERDWSAAAFWYEYIALHGGELFFPDLTMNSLQGDKRIANIFAKLGVEILSESMGVRIRNSGALPIRYMHCSFKNCPDLYPAVFAVCYEKGTRMRFSGLASLPLKESDRLAAMKQLTDKQKHILCTHKDHRIAMAFIAAGYEVDDTACICKSYPLFMEQWKTLQS